MMSSKDMIKKIEKYKPSGKISALSIPLMLIFGCIFGIAGGGLIYLISIFTEFYLIFVFSIVIGLGAGMGLKLGIKIGKCRNQILGFLLGLIVAFLSYASMHLFDSIFTQGYGLNDFFYYIKQYTENYTYTINDIEISGSGVWIVLGIEALIVFIVTIVISISNIKHPFVEECKEWCDDKQTFTVSKSLLDEITSILYNKEFKKLPELIKNSKNTINSPTDNVTVELLYSSKCKFKGYISLTTIITTGRSKTTHTPRTILFNAVINDGEALEALLSI